MAIQYTNCTTVEKDWVCSSCHDSAQTDVVAHVGLGSKHPIHKECLYEWRKFSKLCPDCKVETAVDGIFPPATRVNQAIKRTKVHPQNLLAGLGAILLLGGYKYQISWIQFLGLSLQYIGVDQALSDEMPRFVTIRKIDALCKEILKNGRFVGIPEGFQNHRMYSQPIYNMEKIRRLDQISAFSDKYQKALHPWIDNVNSEIKFIGVKTLQEIIDRDFLIHRVIRLYRNITGIAALLIAAKSLCRFSKITDVSAHPNNQLFLKVFIAAIFSFLIEDPY